MTIGDALSNCFPILESHDLECFEHDITKDTIKCVVLNIGVHRAPNDANRKRLESNAYAVWCINRKIIFMYYGTL